MTTPDPTHVQTHDAAPPATPVRPIEYESLSARVTGDGRSPLTKVATGAGLTAVCAYVAPLAFPIPAGPCFLIGVVANIVGVILAIIAVALPPGRYRRKTAWISLAFNGGLLAFILLNVLVRL